MSTEIICTTRRLQCSIFEQKYLLLNPDNQYNRKKAVYQKQQKSFVDDNLPKELIPGLFLKGHMNVNAKELGSK
jgi:hypothetical protein